MPIYEFACSKCRKVFSFLSKRIAVTGTPKCPKCGSKKLSKEISRFAMITGAPEPVASTPTGAEEDMPMPDFEDPKVARAMSEMENAMDHLDENNPRHMAVMLRKMKDVMPEGSIPKEFDVALKRLEAGEDPDKIEADMGDVLGGLMGDGTPSADGGGGPYSKDAGLYDY